MLRILFLLCFLIVLPIVRPFEIEDGNEKRLCDYDVLPQALYTNHTLTQNVIIGYHNYFRANVHPQASNMLRMNWNAEAATLSENRAFDCNFREYKIPSIPSYHKCGQSIYTASKKVSWDIVIGYWYSLGTSYSYNISTPEAAQVDAIPYIQMVRAPTHMVGCALGECKTADTPPKIYYTYVCTYCPGGGTYRRPYKSGVPCSSCLNKCYKGKLCTNACPYADAWGTRECHTQINICQTYKQESRENCDATCLCGKGGQIFERVEDLP